jgi:3-dehydroquinate synthase
LHDIYSQLIENNFGRDTTLIAIGGGVVGDLAGFAAATFMRGIKVVNVPTTLLAMVDSSIGGKTSINFLAKKNIVGSFYQPGYVLIDTFFLKTLPVSELKCGAGEIIKYAFLSDKNFFNSLLNDFGKIFKNNNDYLEETISNCASIKASVVSNDEKESGLRKILNLGHTFAHAYESCLNFKIKHGIAVNAGVISALFLSNELGIIDDKNVETFLKLPLKLKSPKVLSSLEKDSIYNVMLSDKKNRNGKIKFVLPLEIGKIIMDIEAEKKEIYSALDRTFALIKKQ